MQRPGIFGILNLTTDSFSDGGRYLDPPAALDHARQLVTEGADVVDVGAASSHPDSEDVGAAEEIRRLAAVLPRLVAEGIEVSVDSFEPDVQLWAMGQGAAWLNDIQGFPDPAIYPALASGSARLIVMHGVQGRGRARRLDVPADEIWARIFAFFDARLAALEAAGIARSRLVLDPGMGFFLGTDPAVSLRVLRELPRLAARYGLPVLVSVSRKSFLRALTGRDAAGSAAATLAAELFAAQAGASYIRTHDAGALHDALRIHTALMAPVAPGTGG